MRWVNTELVSFTGRSNCFTKTVPTGNFQSLVAENVICSAAVLCVPSFGTANQRFFTAPSDQSGELTVYACRPGNVASVVRLVNTPSVEIGVAGSGMVVTMALSL